MNFPRIEHIDDVLPHIEGRDEFKVMERDECTTIDYVYQSPKTFSHPILRECRGIKFCNETGRIIARPFQKFFNLGEKPSEERGRDFDEAQVWEKADGSLLHFIFYQGKLRACTKAGITDVSLKAEKELELSDKFFKVMGSLTRLGYTPCFEYVSPNNRIVVRYEEPSLKLLVIRHNTSGDYLDVNLRMYAEVLGVEVAERFPSFRLSTIKEWKDREGVVLAWPDGYRLKVKADDYVLRHRVKDDITREHRLMEIVLNESVDDLVGVVDAHDYEVVLSYQKYVLGGVQASVSRLNSMLDSFKGMERKDVAKLVAKHPKPLQSVFWQCYSGKDAREALVEFLLKKTNKQTSLDMVRVLFDNDVSEALNQTK